MMYFRRPRKAKEKGSSLFDISIDTDDHLPRFRPLRKRALLLSHPNPLPPRQRKNPHLLLLLYRQHRSQLARRRSFLLTSLQSRDSKSCCGNNVRKRKSA